jgi:hypothetical protein
LDEHPSRTSGGEMKRKKLKLIMWSDASEREFSQLLKESLAKGYTRKEFEKAWYEAYEERVQRIAMSQFKKRMPEMAAALIKHGNEEQAAVGWNYLNTGIAYWEDRYRAKKERLA